MYIRKIVVPLWNTCAEYHRHTFYQHQLTSKMVQTTSQTITVGGKRPRLPQAGYVRVASSDVLVPRQTTPAGAAKFSVVNTTTTNPNVVLTVTPTQVGEKRGAGRPSKISVSNRARLLGPSDAALPITLYQTTNYDQFIIPTGVAEPTEGEVDVMRHRIATRDLLALNPIIVTPYLEVYEGKKRLAAARADGKPLAYVIDENLSVGDIIADRGEPRGWEFDQYCIYYAEQGRREYAKLVAFATEHQLPLGAAASLLKGGSSQDTTQILADFKRGLFTITNEAHALKVIELRNKQRQTAPKLEGKKDMTQQRVYLNALSQTLGREDVDNDILERVLTHVKWQPTENDYQRHLSRLVREEMKKVECELVA